MSHSLGFVVERLIRNAGCAALLGASCATGAAGCAAPAPVQEPRAPSASGVPARAASPASAAPTDETTRELSDAESLARWYDASPYPPARSPRAGRVAWQTRESGAADDFDARLGHDGAPNGDTGAWSRARPRRSSLRDFDFQGGSLADALRLFATVGDFNLLLQGSLTEPVSVSLRRVEPYDALVAVAHAHGASVSFAEGVVVVQGR